MSETNISVTLDIGGEGSRSEMDLKVVGCDCRRDDFIMALSRFTRDWRREADLRVEITPKPASGDCGGCSDAK